MASESEIQEEVEKAREAKLASTEVLAMNDNEEVVEDCRNLL